MIGFSIMMWFISILLIFLGISLLKGNYFGVHGRVFETTTDKEGYAKELGKPTLLIGYSNFRNHCSYIATRLFHYYRRWIFIIYYCYRWNMVLSSTKKIFLNSIF